MKTSHTHRDDSRPLSHHLVALASVLLCGAAGFALLIMLAGPSHAVQGNLNRRPYGGCDEAWQAPHSAGADWCRDHGWTVNGSVVVGPHAVLRYSTLPACDYEDGGRYTPRCIWVGYLRGNHHGLTLWYDVHGNRHYVWPFSPLTWTIGPPMRWVSSALSDALAESGVRHAARDWTRCAVQYAGTTTVVCPDGQIVRS